MKTTSRLEPKTPKDTIMNHCISRLSRAVLLALPLAAGAPLAHAAGEAKNVIFFLGDGMGPVTVTAARIYKGEKQLAAQPGSLVSPERANLSMQLLPYAARIKTFSLDGQTTDSAPSMAAYMTGVKMRNEVISMSADTVAVDGAGKQYVSGEDSTCPRPTARPPRRCWNWPRPRAARSAPCRPRASATPRRPPPMPTCATATATTPSPNNRRRAMRTTTPGLATASTCCWAADSATTCPPLNPASKRTDGVNLVTAFQARGYTYVDTGTALRALNPAATGKLLGLFSQSEMAYELDRVKPALGYDQPSLAEMTDKALGVLSKNSNGFFLMVEGGRIDHALHGTNAKRALEDTLAFDSAIQTALDFMEKKDPGLKNTLIVVTADHDHAIAFNGYPKIGNPILGTVKSYADGKPALAADGKPYTTLVFGNGGRPNADADSKTNPEDGNKAWIAPARARATI